jgi:hypothetical protein
MVSRFLIPVFLFFIAPVCALFLLHLLQTPTPLPTPVRGRIRLSPFFQSKHDVFRTAGPAYTLSAVPLGPGVPDPEVFLNGLLQLAGTDYTISGSTLTFASSDLGDSPIIQVIYWVE